MSQGIFNNIVLHIVVLLFDHLEVVKFLIKLYLQKHSVMPYIYTVIAMMRQIGCLKGFCSPIGTPD